MAIGPQGDGAVVIGAKELGLDRFKAREDSWGWMATRLSRCIENTTALGLTARRKAALLEVRLP